MIKNAVNKSAEEQTPHDITSTASEVEGELKPYHYGGHGQYYPITIHAKNQEDADRVWLQKRVPFEK